MIVTTLAYAGIWKSGSTPKREDSSYYHGKIPWLKTGELNDGIVFDSEEKITQKALNDFSLPINEIGNVLIAMYGATIGKLAIAGVQLTTNQACCGCRPYSCVCNKYLFYYLLYFKEKFIKAAEGSGQPNISKEKIMASPFILPPYNYQLRVSEKLDQILKEFFE